MNNLVGTNNAGFEILEQGTNAVLAVRESDGMFVSWSYHLEPKKGDWEASFYWGRYGTEEYARDCFNKKERGEYSVE